jgi:hypothetical protein
MIVFKEGWSLPKTYLFVAIVLLINRVNGDVYASYDAFAKRV